MRVIEERNAVVSRNLGLVVAVARRYQGRGLDMDDLVGAGFIGLIKAVERYEEKPFGKFASFAVVCVKTAIRDAIRATGRPIRLPDYISNLLVKWRRVEARLGDELGRPASFDEVADALNLSRLPRERARDGLMIRFAPSSITEDVTEDRRAAEFDAETLGRLRMALATLPARDRAVIESRFGFDGEPQTLAEIGEALGITRQAAHYLERRALDHLRGLLGPQVGNN